MYCAEQARRLVLTTISAAAVHEVAIDRSEARTACPRHGGGEPGTKEGEHARDSLGAERRKPPEHGAADEDSGRAERQGLEDIGSPSDATIHEDGAAASHRVDDGWEDIDGRGCPVKLPRAVVGDDDA